MADVTITPANIAMEPTTALGSTFESGELMTPGHWAYFDTADGNKVKLCDASAQLSSVVKGMVLNEVVKIGQPVTLALTGSTVNMGVCLGALAHPYMLSQTAGGKMKPIDPDLAATDYLTFLGYSLSTSQFRIEIDVTGLLHTA